MKILMAERSDIYHDARVQKEANSLVRNNYEVTVYGLRDSIRNYDSSYEFKLLTFFVLPRGFGVLRKLHLFFLILSLNIRATFTKADFYHAHNTMILAGMWLGAKLFKGKFIYDSHEVQWEANFLQGFLEEIFIEKVDRIINVSRGRAVEQAKRYGSDEAKISVISNYPVFSGKHNSYVREMDGKVRFVYSGGFHLGTNRLDNLIRSLASFENIDLDLMAFSYGNGADTLLRIIHEMDLSNRVRFIPLVKPSEVIPRISSYDFAVNMLINPRNSISLDYPSINKVYEYLAAGLPILCSNLPSFEEEIVSTGAGVSVDPTDLDSISSGLKKILAKSKDEISQMKENAYLLAAGRYNWSTQEAKLLNLYGELEKQLESRAGGKGRCS